MPFGECEEVSDSPGNPDAPGADAGETTKPRSNDPGAPSELPGYGSVGSGGGPTASDGSGQTIINPFV